MHIQALSRHEPPDFVVLFSSLAATLGGIGQADYCAANAFLGSHAEHQSRSGEALVCAVEWDAWQADSWLARGIQSTQGLFAAVAERRSRGGLALADGFALLERVLAARLPRVVVSRRDPERMAVWYDRSHDPGKIACQLRAGSSPATTATTQHGTIPPDDLRPGLRRIVSDTLKGVPLDDDVHFTDLGLNSLLALDLASRLSEEFCMEIPIGLIYDNPSVSRLSLRIEAAITARTTELLRSLEAVEKMTPEQAQAELDAITDR